ncbi:hypothetical protein [Mycolicibacterium sphagni]|uniref:PE-PGRS family protein n=1 Tax=Mycolicibacterium sphagni TaxID=1786 RepID=A0A255DMI0_9MYCO|nr:hypothetical protein [Mycolicibacterium sphagni]OYN78425.1 hypothetical protein CG716_15570 [Mycolicibacterium sphagni]
MQLALNRTVTAGVALVGASAIALTPIVASSADVQLPSIHSAEVQMAAFVNPIEEWVQVIGTSFTNLSALGTQVQGDPTPILSQLATNFLANAKTLVDTASQTFGQAVTTFASMPQAFLTAAQQVAAGHVADAVQTIWGSVLLPPAFLLIIPISAVIPIVQTAVQNVANVIGALGGTNLLLTGIAVISPIYATITQFGNSAQALVDALKAGDFVTAASAVINAPAQLVNAFLNGDDTTPGLLTPLDGVGGGGAIAALLKLRDAVAEAIAPPTTPSSAAVKALSAKTAAPAEATSSDTTTGTVSAHGSAKTPTAGRTSSANKAGGASSTNGEKTSGKAGSGRHRGAA